MKILNELMLFLLIKIFHYTQEHNVKNMLLQRDRKTFKLSKKQSVRLGLKEKLKQVGNKQLNLNAKWRQFIQLSRSSKRIVSLSLLFIFISIYWLVYLMCHTYRYYRKAYCVNYRWTKPTDGVLRIKQNRKCLL